MAWIFACASGCAAGASGGLVEPGEEGSLEECSDLEDNDGDGLADCRDPQCGRHERCSADFDPDQDPDGLEPEDPGPDDAAPGDDSGDPGPGDVEVPEPDPAPTCTAEGCVAAGGSHCCGEECIDYYTDLDNCGACGAECRFGFCAASFCLCNDPLPDICGAYDDGGHTCTDFATDHDNCGGCGRVCGADEACCAGVCGDAC